MAREQSADDFATVRRNLLRNRIIAMTANIGMSPSTIIPKEMFLAAGYTEAEFNAIPQAQRTLPILETDLR